jgi:hypothetical protein
LVIWVGAPRRRDDERPQYPRASVEPVANVAQFSLAPRQFTTHCGGLFLFLPGLLSLGLDQLARAAHLPGSKMIPAQHALRACLALKLWSIERKSHVMALVADELEGQQPITDSAHGSARRSD